VIGKEFLLFAKNDKNAAIDLIGGRSPINPSNMTEGVAEIKHNFLD